MGSDSDLPTAEKAATDLGCGCGTLGLLLLGADETLRVCGIEIQEAAARQAQENAEENGFGVIISIAGMAAHLGGVLAANTVLPVIGVPVGSSFGGLDALLATVQMPSGIPVATVALGGGKNAAILAAQMLALSDDSLREKLRGMRKEMAEAVREKDDIISNQFKN